MSEVKTASGRICVVGSANLDLTFRTPRLPMPGETLAGHSLHQGMGGKGANQAVAAARLGAHVTFVARVGNDTFGTQALHAYQAEGIDTSFIKQDADRPTGTAAILVDDHAENCIIVIAGANEGLTSNDINAASSVIEQANLVLCQLETPIDATVAAFRIARAAGALTVLTPAPVAFVTDELLALCDLCVPNMTEIAALCGCPDTVAKLVKSFGSRQESQPKAPTTFVTDEHLDTPLVCQPAESHDDAVHAAELLRNRGVKRVILTMGGNGALVVDDTGATHIPAMKVKAVDTTGAGDAFTAALAVSLADGLDLREAARRASIVAAISVTRFGTQTAFPSLSEVTEWANQ